MSLNFLVEAFLELYLGILYAKNRHIMFLYCGSPPMEQYQEQIWKHPESTFRANSEIGISHSWSFLSPGK